jgi:hypothetical protein
MKLTTTTYDQRNSCMAHVTDDRCICDMDIGISVNKRHANKDMFMSINSHRVYTRRAQMCVQAILVYAYELVFICWLRITLLVTFDSVIWDGALLPWSVIKSSMPSLCTSMYVWVSCTFSMFWNMQECDNMVFECMYVCMYICMYVYICMWYICVSQESRRCTLQQYRRSECHGYVIRIIRTASSYPQICSCHPPCHVRGPRPSVLSSVAGVSRAFGLVNNSERQSSAFLTCKTNGNFQRFSTADLYQFTAGIALERFSWFLQVAVGYESALGYQNALNLLMLCTSPSPGRWRQSA